MSYFVLGDVTEPRTADQRAVSVQTGMDLFRFPSLTGSLRRPDNRTVPGTIPSEGPADVAIDQAVQIDSGESRFTANSVDQLRKLSSALEKAKRAARRTLRAADTQDVVERSNAVGDIRIALQDLWECRSLRDRSWTRLVNSVQISLGVQNYELLASDQLKFVANLLLHDLQAGIVDEEQARLIKVRLRDVKLDPWAAFSPPEHPTVE